MDRIEGGCGEGNTEEAEGEAEGEGKGEGEAKDEAGDAVAGALPCSHDWINW